MAEPTLEQRVAALEQAVAALQSKPAPPNGPSFGDDPVFRDMLAYGRYFRKTGREAPPDWKPGDPIPEPDGGDSTGVPEAVKPIPVAGKPNWLAAVLGKFKDNADYAEAARVGHALRATGRLPDVPPAPEVGS